MAIYSCVHCRKPATPDEAALKPSWETTEGTPFPLGVSWNVREQAYNFALYSRHAARVTLALYRPDSLTVPALTHAFDPLRNKSGPVWHCRIPLSQTAGFEYYGYRIEGPMQNSPAPVVAFDPTKLLLDPYAKAVYFPPGFDPAAACKPGSNEGQAPLGLLNVCQCGFEWGKARRLRHGSDLIIYEMHVRGFTRHPSSAVSSEKRGTFTGIVEKIPYLSELGITAVELMPVFQFDSHNGNYWGYMPLNFFSPHHGYAVNPEVCAQYTEFREMVKALHEAGIEVILDVVYNHTGEGNHLGPVYSLKGIDASTYYMASGDASAPFADYTGTGNTLNTANGAVRRLIVDSLRYWVKEMHVDGFRFDLASIFTRSPDGSINLNHPPIFDQIAGDPELSGVRLIAEPWDARGAYQLGQRFPGDLWMQWNGAYRDTLQRFVRGDPGLVAGVMTRLYGSADLFPDDVSNAFRPYESVNYITSHDGFTLYDLVTYSQRRNWANGHDNMDGPSCFSSNSGWEGDDQVPREIVRLRKQLLKNFCCLLLLSNGTPMFRMGDEFMHTQGGNNNPYNQDNDTTWLDWRRLEANRDVFRFFKEMIAFRKAHPSLGRSTFWRDDIRWCGAHGPVDFSPGSRSLAFWLRGGSQGDDDVYVMINARSEELHFGIHDDGVGSWRRVIDTSLPSPEDFAVAGEEPVVSASDYAVAAKSVVVLIRR